MPDIPTRFSVYGLLADPILITHANGELAYVNKWAQHVFNIAEDWQSPLTIHDVCDIFGEFDPQAVKPQHGNGHWKSAVHNVTIGDDERFLKYRVAPLELKDADWYIYHVHDVSELSQASRNLADTTQLLNSLLASSILPVFALDKAGLFHMFNPAAESMFGIKEDALLGKPLDALLSQLDAQAMDTASCLEKARKSTTYECELDWVNHENAHEYSVALTLMPILNQDGTVSGYVVLGRDISAEKRREKENQRLAQQIQRAQKLESLGVLAGGIAHDFNNILIGILGNANLAMMDLPPESPVRGTLKEVERSAQKAADLVKQMLAYSGKGKYVVEELNLTRVIEEMSHLLEATVDRDVVVKYHLAPNLPLIEGDVAQIRQVVMNLVTNASEAIENRSGVVSITTGAMEIDPEYLREAFINDSLLPGIYAYIEVSDTGIGMDEATRQKIFDPFFSTKFTGRGLGLAAVLGIVRSHRGTIKTYSEVGRGSTFKVLLPAKGTFDPNARPDITSEDLPSEHAHMVLVVDDMDTVRAVARQTLERFGFSVMTAADGREAIERFRQNPDVIDLVLLDMSMPHMSGEETYREMRRIKKDVCVVLSSGYNEREATERFAGKGLAGFIQKPYKPLDLVQIIRDVLGIENGNGNGNGKVKV